MCGLGGGKTNGHNICRDVYFISVLVACSCLPQHPARLAYSASVSFICWVRCCRVTRGAFIEFVGVLVQSNEVGITVTRVGWLSFLVSEMLPNSSASKHSHFRRS